MRSVIAQSVRVIKHYHYCGLNLPIGIVYSPHPTQSTQSTHHTELLSSGYFQLGEEELNTPKYISSTTTLRPSTTTTLPPRREPVTGGQLTQPTDEIFEGCNSTKACFGKPAGCVESGLCEMVVAYWPDKQDYHFQMKVRTLHWVHF